MKEEIMKCIVETNGSFMLLNSTMEVIPSQRPSVTSQTPFVDSRIMKKEVKVLAKNLPRKASDEDFAAHLKASKGKVELAVKSFCAMFGQDSEGNKLEEVEVDAEADKKAKEKAEADKKAKEKAEADKKAKEKAE